MLMSFGLRSSLGFYVIALRTKSIDLGELYVAANDCFDKKTHGVFRSSIVSDWNEIMNAVYSRI